MIGEGGRGLTWEIERYAPAIVVRLTVQAHPGASKERLELLEDRTVGVWVSKQAVNGQANDAVERALASALHLRAGDVKIVVGATSRRKIVEIDLPSLDELHRRLLAYGLRPRSNPVNAEHADGDS